MPSKLDGGLLRVARQKRNEAIARGGRIDLARVPDMQIEEMTSDAEGGGDVVG